MVKQAVRGTRTSPFSMRLQPELREAIQRLADAERRSFTNYVEYILAQHVEEMEAARKKR